MPEPLTLLTAVAIPFDEPNIDTDQMVPARFSKLPIGPGHERVLFHDRRFLPDGSPNPEFVFNRPEYRDAKILVARRNFGIGSSRESAVMSVWSFGLRVLVAPSFGDIFYNNCFKRGLLPIRLAEEEVDRLFAWLLPRPGAPVRIDLPAQTLMADALCFSFAVSGVHKTCLVQGLDEVSVTETHRPQIEAFESTYYDEFPWLADQLEKAR
ncbi:MAG: 3-isopropylmalate dehydratase small subunit [Burkholderiales bacterium]|nr:3-isopropylmalate dehydratase small subunit [Burkholderiales bacterium]